ncbi:hypothetical protein LTR62_002718 [Meristemomyces frigidus]|uniref:Uncharacterized protein n=1 Tax=Meristemomyces frigidus TaxID=1508187 RepID=A0AAN7YL26_9PEZI|nr:hypothetical protein LTR62_002718 [Meristemomyces frigidus]
MRGSGEMSVASECSSIALSQTLRFDGIFFRTTFGWPTSRLDYEHAFPIWHAICDATDDETKVPAEECVPSDSGNEHHLLALKLSQDRDQRQRARVLLQRSDGSCASTGLSACVGAYLSQPGKSNDQVRRGYHVNATMVLSPVADTVNAAVPNERYNYEIELATEELRNVPSTGRNAADLGSLPSYSNKMIHQCSSLRYAIFAGACAIWPFEIAKVNE